MDNSPYIFPIPEARMSRCSPAAGAFEQRAWISASDLAVELGISRRTLARWLLDVALGFPRPKIRQSQAILRAKLRRGMESRNRGPGGGSGMTFNPPAKDRRAVGIARTGPEVVCLSLSPLFGHSPKKPPRRKTKNAAAEHPEPKATVLNVRSCACSRSTGLLRSASRFPAQRAAPTLAI